MGDVKNIKILSGLFLGDKSRNKLRTDTGCLKIKGCETVKRGA